MSIISVIVLSAPTYAAKFIDQENELPVLERINVNSGQGRQILEDGSETFTDEEYHDLVEAILKGEGILYDVHMHIASTASNKLLCTLRTINTHFYQQLNRFIAFPTIENLVGDFSNGPLYRNVIAQNADYFPDAFRLSICHNATYFDFKDFLEKPGGKVSIICVGPYKICESRYAEEIEIPSQILSNNHQLDFVLVQEPSYMDPSLLQG